MSLKIKGKKTIALTQIVLLIVSLFAICWMIGSSVEVVSASDQCDPGEKRCIGKSVEQCSEDGTSWTVVTQCTDRCENGVCTQSETNNNDNGNDLLNVGGGAIVNEAVDQIGNRITTSSATPTTSGGALPAAETSSGFFKGVFGEWGKFFTGNYDLAQMGAWSKVGYGFKAFATALATTYLIEQILTWAGGSERNIAGATTAALVGGLGAATVVTILVVCGVSGPPGWIVAAVTAVFAGLWILFGWQTYSQEVFNYQTQIWQPVTGGEKCSLCNQLEYGCNEYQCHSYGQDCVLTNKGTNEEKCIWQNPGDSQPPLIMPIEEVLPNYPNSDFSYIPLDITASPGERGVEIVYNNEECLPAFTSITLGIETDEVSHCKVDIERQNSSIPEEAYENMISFMNEGSLNVINHTLYLPSSVNPSSEALLALGLSAENGEEKEFFMRCQDTNGNINPLDYIIKFCIDQSPDTTAPRISGTNYLPNSPNYIPYNSTSAVLEVYTDEPADCRWDFFDTTYNEMEYNMSDCSSDITDFLNPNLGLYGCSGEISGIERGTNNFYIRCKDKPWLDESDVSRYANRESYPLSLIGTEALVITSAEPDGELIRGGLEEVPFDITVTTALGAREGYAKCYYNQGNGYNQFYNNGNTNYTYSHIQRLRRVSGNYTYDIECRDEAGNVAQTSINFRVETDIQEPSVVRVYREDNYLKIVTSENSKCVYSDVDCVYDFDTDGLPMTSESGDYDTVHYTEWKTGEDLYIKCEDDYGNRPISNQCSIIVRPFEVPELKN